MSTQDIINCWETGVEPYNATKEVSEYPEIVADNESNETREAIMANCKLCGSQANVLDIPAFSRWAVNHGCNYGKTS